VSGSEQSHTHAYTPTHRVFDRHRLMRRGAHKTKQKTANRRASSDADFTMMCVVATEVPTPHTHTQPTAELLAGNRGHSKSAPTPAWALSHKPSRPCVCGARREEQACGTRKSAVRHEQHPMRRCGERGYRAAAHQHGAGHPAQASQCHGCHRAESEAGKKRGQGKVLFV
jgi:hypothetical protein